MKETIEFFKLWKRRRKSHKDYINFQEFRARILNKEILKHLKNTENKKLLDVGSHRGGYSIAFKKLGYDVTGIEYDPNKIKTAKEESSKLGLKIKFVQSDARNLPLKNNQFDIVILSNVIEHIPNTDKLLKELNRVMKEKAILYIQFPPYWGLFGGHVYFRFLPIPLHYLPKNIAYSIIKLLKLDSELNEVEMITLKKLKNESKQAGFEIISLKTYPGFIKAIPLLKELSPFCKALLRK